MRVTRHTPQAINKPLLIVGIERCFIGGLLMISSVVYAEIHWAVGIAVFFGGCFAAKAATRKDPEMIQVARQLWTLKPIYDAVKREVKQ